MAEEAPVSLRIRPEKIEMGAFYNGAKVRIEGVVPASSRVLVVLRGAENDEFFNKKGRVGPIWLNTDRVHITQAPSLFLSYSSDDVSSLLDRAVIDEYQLDEAAIQKRMRARVHCKCPVSTKARTGAGSVVCKGTAPDEHYGELIRRNYLAVKLGEGSYQRFANSVRVADAEGGATRYSLEFLWPRKAPPGSYRVEVYACRNRAVVARSSASLDVLEVGFPAQMASLAGERPWVYGLFAVVAAVIAGFGIDAVAARLRRPRQRPQAGKVSHEPPRAKPGDATSTDLSEEEEHAHRH